MRSLAIICMLCAMSEAAFAEPTNDLVMRQQEQEIRMQQLEEQVQSQQEQEQIRELEQAERDRLHQIDDIYQDAKLRGMDEWPR